MPPRRRGARAPRRRRMGVKKAQRMLKRVWNRKAKTNGDTYPLKLVREYVCEPVAKDLGGNYIGIYQPFAAFDAGSSGSEGSVWNFPEFQLNKQMYDRVRINSVKLEWLPKANYTDLNNLLTNTTITSTGDLQWHTVIDRDSASTFNKAALTRYSSYKRFSIFKRWSRTMRLTYPKSYWINLQDPNGDLATLQAIGGRQFITAYCENLPIDISDPTYNIFGSFKVSVNVVFQGKITPRVVKQDDGGMTVYSSHQVGSLAPTPITFTDEVPLKQEGDFDILEVVECCGMTGATGPTGPEGPPK